MLLKIVKTLLVGRERTPEWFEKRRLWDEQKEEWSRQSNIKNREKQRAKWDAKQLKEIGQNYLISVNIFVDFFLLNVGKENIVKVIPYAGDIIIEFNGDINKESLFQELIKFGFSKVQIRDIEELQEFEKRYKEKKQNKKIMEIKQGIKLSLVNFQFNDEEVIQEFENQLNPKKSELEPEKLKAINEENKNKDVEKQIELLKHQQAILDRQIELEKLKERNSGDRM